MEVRELLSFYEYDGDNAPVVSGSALGALNGEAQWVDTVMKLMEVLMLIFQNQFVITLKTS
jgi:elongation factor Tu